MRIWFDVTSSDLPAISSSGECDDCSDCQENSGGHTHHILAEHEASSLLNFPTRTFQQATPLYTQQVVPQRTLVCHPTGSGQIAVLDDEAFALLQHFRTPTSFAAIHKEMCEFTASQIEQAMTLFLQYGFLQNSQHPISGHHQNRSETLSAWLHVTNACNLRCSYCYLHKTPDHMEEDTGRQAIDAIFRSATRQRFRSVRLRYAGGEASLRVNQLLALHDYAALQADKYKIGLHAFVISNGVYLPQHVIKQLRQRHIGVTISLDGIGQYHDSQRPFLNGRGSFQYVERTIQQLIAQDLAPFIAVTVSQRNLAGLPALMEFILARKLPFSLSYYRDNECSSHIHDLQYENEQMITGMRAAFAVIERQLPRWSLRGTLLDKASLQAPHQRTCGVGQNYMVIDQNGKIAKCHADIASTVATIDADDPLQLVQNDTHGVQGYSVEQKEGCRTCTWRNWCTGGCPLLTYRATGRYDVKSPNCSIYQALFPDVLRLEGLRLLDYTQPVTI